MIFVEVEISETFFGITENEGPSVGAKFEPNP